MSGLLPMAMFGQEVYPGDVPQPASPNLPASFRITMAAIDPNAEPEGDEGTPVRSTLKIIRINVDEEEDSDDDDDESFDADEMERMLAEEEADDSEDDEDVNGGPSDPSKSKQARVLAAIEKLKEAEDMEVDDESDDELPNGVNGVSKSAKAKGKMPASDEEDDEDDEDEDDEEDVEEFVVCTLDPQKNYQQTLDIHIGEDERVFFQVTGTHSIYLTGNYVEPADSRPGLYDPDDDEDEDYDLEPDLDELDDEDEEDELDDLEDPRITEVDEDDEAPKLVEATKKTKADKKANNKRPAPDDAEPETLDEMILKESAPAADGQKLSKKQLKKLKKNDGSAAAPEAAAEAPSSQKSDKKVSFAKELEQGPTPTKADAKDGKGKTTLGVKTVQGVTIDDKKLGTGPAAKPGDRVGMRYIGKLQKNGKVFDSNKKGKPFTFKLGVGEVIKGWDIGVQGLSIGGERRITIPAHLAYGAKGAGPDIPPNSTLIFDIKLIELNKGK